MHGFQELEAYHDGSQEQRPHHGTTDCGTTFPHTSRGRQKLCAAAKMATQCSGGGLRRTGDTVEPPHGREHPETYNWSLEKTLPSTEFRDFPHDLPQARSKGNSSNLSLSGASYSDRVYPTSTLALVNVLTGIMVRHQLIKDLVGCVDQIFY